jgi:hypothetical protein
MYKKDLKVTYYIIKDGKVLGRCSTHETAYKVCFIEKAAWCCVYDNLISLEDEWLYQLYQDYVGDLPPPPMVVEQMAREVFAALEKTEFPAVLKPSVKKVLRAMYEFKRQWQREELIEVITKVQWGSIKTAMVELRREGIDIRHHGDGWYVRR